ncbi:MAG TPA: DUF4252 domain-containing protein [Draconibacterium sp.]|nr:DUF4252 domain-containing protein [Draconibacterium sp.]
MKTITTILSAFVLLISQLAGAQSKSDKMYDAFINKDGISSFTFSKNMIDAINIDLGENGEEKKVTGDLHQIRFMSYNPEKGDLSGPKFLEKAIGYLPKSGYQKYEEEEDDSNTEIWLMGGKKKFQECHVFVRNEQENQMQFVVSFYGDFTVNDLKKLRKTGKDFSEEDK